MDAESLNVLLQFYSSNTANEANLWMMYVAATIACAGYGVTSNTLTSIKMAVAASIGFLAFAYGQYTMVNEAIFLRELLVVNLAPAKSSPIGPFIAELSVRGLTIQGAIKTHAVVDACVVFLIMYRPVAELLKVYLERRKVMPTSLIDK